MAPASASVPIDITVDGETFSAGAGTFVAAPPAFSTRSAGAGSAGPRLLNIHAPSRGFHEFLRRES